MTKSESSSSADKLEIAERLRKVEAYGKPKRVWVDDGHVFVEGHDGTIVSMTPYKRGQFPINSMVPVPIQR
jgi:hypothetical protein